MGAEAEPAIDALASILRSRRVGRYSDLRSEAERALGAIGAAAGEEAARLVGDADPDVRDSGLDVLRLIGPDARQAAPVLRDLLGHKDTDVRKKAAEGLSHLALGAEVAVKG
ncbi:MAG: HEAT repeat domain-containing protein [Planctomycetota bacterium]